MRHSVRGAVQAPFGCPRQAAIFSTSQVGSSGPIGQAAHPDSPRPHGRRPCARGVSSVPPGMQLGGRMKWRFPRATHLLVPGLCAAEHAAGAVLEDAQLVGAGEGHEVAACSGGGAIAWSALTTRRTCSSVSTEGLERLALRCQGTRKRKAFVKEGHPPTKPNSLRRGCQHRSPPTPRHAGATHRVRPPHSRTPPALSPPHSQARRHSARSPTGEPRMKGAPLMTTLGCLPGTAAHPLRAFTTRSHTRTGHL